MTVSKTSRVWIGMLLVLLMAFTRTYHTADLVHLPDAYWAVFFLAGFYLPQSWIFPAFFLLAASVDLVAITWGGVNGGCVSSAYLALPFAYGAMFLGGRIYAKQHRPVWNSLPRLAITLFLSTAFCELVSSASFYFFSGRFAETSLGEMGMRLASYFPGSLIAVAFYLSCAAAVHVFLSLMHTRAKSGLADSA